MILVVDYGLGNLLSVAKAFEEVAWDKQVVISSDPKDMEKAEYIILPGVGNFKTGMRNLNELGLIEPLREQVIMKKKPFLGICLGLHVLAKIGEESGATPGLEWLPGNSRKLNAPGLKLPHIGWNNLEVFNKHPLFEGIARSKEFYFVHKFCIDCPEEYIIASCTYGETFAAAIQKDNIYATQFHPEKSREAGLKLLGNFLKISKEGGSAC